MEKEKLSLRKIVALLTLFVYSAALLPAKELQVISEQSRIRLERYLDRAGLERNEKRWRETAELGLLSALNVWENAALSELEYGEELKNQRESLIKIIERRYLEWRTRLAEETAAKTERSAFRQELEKLSENWTYTAEDGKVYSAIPEEWAGAARRAWEADADSVLQRYMERHSKICADMIISTDTPHLTEAERTEIQERASSAYYTSVRMEYQDIAAELQNKLLRNMLYDQSSLKKAADSEAAGLIAMRLAEETRSYTDRRLGRLFAEANSTIKAEDGAMSEEEWITSFENAMEQSLRKWEEAEEAFFIQRSEWERNAAEIYEADKAEWDQAYQTLLSKREAWNVEIAQQLEEGRKLWSQKKTALQEEINSVLEEYAQSLENETRMKENEISVKIDTYNQNRAIAATSYSGIELWMEHWAERYKGLYSYWKTEDGQGSIVSELFKPGTSSFEDKSYITTEQELEEFLRAIAEWKKLYIKAVQNEIQRAKAENQSRIEELEAKISAASQDETADKTLLATTRSQLALLISRKTKIEAVEEKINAFTFTQIKSLSELENESLLKGIAEEQSELKHILENARNELNGSNAEKSFFEDPLFSTDETVFSSEQELFYWLKDIPSQLQNIRNSLKSILQSSGGLVTAQGQGGGLVQDELFTEVLKAQCVEEYYLEQKLILENALEYIRNNSAGIDTLEQTEQKLEEAQREYNRAESEYEDAVRALNEQGARVKSVNADIQTEKERLDKALLALAEATQKYQMEAESYKGTSNEVIKKQIEDIIDNINRLQDEDPSKKEQLAQNYYDALQGYYNLVFSEKNSQLQRLLEDGSPAQGIKSREELETVYDYQEILENGWPETEISAEGMQINQLRMELASATLETPEIQLKLLAIEKAVERINLLNEQEIQRRRLITEYIADRTEASPAADFSQEKELALAQAAESTVRLAQEAGFSQVTLPDEASLSSGSPFLQKELNLLLAYEYERILWQEHMESCLQDMLLEIKKGYAEYNPQEIKNKNQAARERIAGLISTSTARNPAEAGYEEAAAFIQALENAGEGLSSVGAAALELYINEYLKSFALARLEKQETAPAGESVQTNRINDCVAYYMEQLETENLSYMKKIISKVREAEGDGGSFEISGEVCARESLLEAYEKYFTREDEPTELETLDAEFITEEAYSKAIECVLTIQEEMEKNQGIRLAYLQGLKQCFDLLKKNQQSDDEKKNAYTSAKNGMSAAEAAYKEAVKGYNDSITRYQSEVKGYSERLSEADSKNKELNNARLSLRSISEIYDWAQNAYLRSEYKDDTGYISQEQRLAETEASLRTAQLSRKILEDLMSSRPEEAEKSYSTEMEDYKAAQERLYSASLLVASVNSELERQQRAVEKAEYAERLAMARGIIQRSTHNTEEKPSANEFAGSLAKIIQEGGSVKFVLKKGLDIKSWTETEGETPVEKSIVKVVELGTWAAAGDYTAEYFEALTEDKTGFLAQKQAEDWIIQTAEKDGNYLNRLVLAALYLEYQEMLASEAEPESAGAYSAPLTQDSSVLWKWGENINGVDAPRAFKETLEKFLQDNYKKMTEKSPEDLAKYLLYKDTYLAGGLRLEEKAVEYLRLQGFEQTKEYVSKRKQSFTDAGIAFAGLAAVFYLIAMMPFELGAWAFIPAAANSLISATEFTKARDTGELYEKIVAIEGSSKQKNEKDNKQTKDFVDNYGTALENLEIQNKKLEQLIYGDSTDRKELSYKDFCSVVGTVIEKNTSVADQKDFSSVIPDSRMYSTIITQAKQAGRAVDSVSGILSAIQEQYRSQAESAASALKQKMSDAQKAQQDALEAYYALLSSAQAQDADIQTVEAGLKAKAQAAFGAGTYRGNDLPELLQSTVTEDSLGRVRYLNGTESYAAEKLELFKQSVLLRLGNEAELLMEQKRQEARVALADMERQIAGWENQYQAILAAGEREWQDALDIMRSGYNEWHAEFSKRLASYDTQWRSSYLDFQQQKGLWTVEQNLRAAEGRWEETISGYGLDADSIIRASLEKSGAQARLLATAQEMAAASLCQAKEMTERGVLKKLLDTGGLLSRTAGTVTMRPGQASATRSDSAEWLRNAMEESAAARAACAGISEKLSAWQMRLQIQETLSAFMEQIEERNRSIREWEESLVLSDGYEVKGKSIRRTTVTDSTLAGNEKTLQTVRYYEDFRAAQPAVTTTDADTMMSLLSWLDRINSWAERIFGRADKDGRQEARTISRSLNAGKGPLDADSLIKEYAAHAQAYGKDEEQNARDREKLDGLTRKITDDGWDSLTDGEKESYGMLTRSLVSMGDGAFAEWVGYEPVFKEGDGLDLKKSADENIETEGYGQMGIIMKDFLWNSMQEQKGLAELEKPLYDKRVCSGGGWLEPPTIREALNVAMEVIGSATGITPLCYLDDILLAGLDLTGGYKTAAEVGLELGKKALTQAAGGGIGAAASWAGGAASAALNTAAANMAARAGISAASSYATSVAASAINSVYIGKDGLAFDAEGFGKSLYSAGTIASAVSAGVTTGLNTGIETKLSGIGDRGAEIQKFYGSAINIGVSAAGKASEYAVHSAYALSQGRTLADAYDEMGGISLNILDAGMIFDLAGTYDARTNGTGQSKWAKAAAATSGMGLLEVNIGRNGVSTSISQDGINIGGKLYTLGKRMEDKAALHAFRDGNDKNVGDAAWYSYVYGDWTQENTAIRLASKLDQLEFVSGKGKGWTAQTTSNRRGGRNILMLDSGNYHTNAIQLGHEAYRNGIAGSAADQKAETIAAVKGHAGMAGRMLGYEGNSIGGIYGIEGALYNQGQFGLLNMIANGMYDSSADYWKLMDDGSLAYDGNGNLYDEKGNLILETGAGIQGGLQAILHINTNEAVQLLTDANFEKDDSKTKCWELDSNNGKIIKFNNKLASGKTYEELYKTTTIKDSITGVEATLEQHNPLNIYNTMLKYGLGPYTYDYSIPTSSNSQWNGRLPIRQLTYKEWKDNNYISNPSLDMIGLSKPLIGEHMDTSPFGWRQNPFDSLKETFHTGTDFSATEGSPIYPMANGTIVTMGWTDYGGNTIILEHALNYNYKEQYIETNYFTDYLHIQNKTTGGVNSSYTVGNTVSTNNTLAYSGTTGPSTGPHLHAGIHFNRIDNNPYANWLYQKGYIEKQNFNNWYGNIYSFMR